MLLPLLVVLSQMHYEGDVPPTGGDYADIEFVVPPGTVEIQISHTDGSDFVVLDWGVWSPEGFRGWGGGNTEDAIVGVQQSSRSYLPGPITPGTWVVSIGKAKVDPTTGGHYSIDVTCRDNATLTVQPRAAFTPTVLSPERRWYKGDFHVHSVESGDASATFTQIAALGKLRGLDFVNLSDHNTNSHHALIAALQPTLPDFLLLRGAEITTYAGHGNSVGTSTYIDHRIGLRGRAIGQILDEVQAQGGVFIVNHPSLNLGGACIGCAWAHPTTDWSKVQGIEIITGKWEFVERAFTPGAIALWDTQEDAGHRLAAIGGSDDHRAGMDTSATGTPIGSPTTLVLADNLSEAAITDAIRHGRTIVQLRGPDDPLVNFTLDLGDRSAEIGDEDNVVSTAKLRVDVTGGTGMFVQIWRDGVKVHQAEVTSDDAKVSYDDNDVGAHRYRVELINDGNQRIVVTSHIYADVVGGTGTCGCNGSSAGLGAAFVLLALRRRRRATP
ncbi:MAG: CehA/McbA family metallohydrolase [Deltaproteobacteria bacterium]|nr:CehA/McbA family metallohydrolase [Deltaproteobacteria bacterium]